jgi:hypothetical protein
LGTETERETEERAGGSGSEWAVRVRSIGTDAGEWASERVSECGGGGGVVQVE